MSRNRLTAFFKHALTQLLFSVGMKINFILGMMVIFFVSFSLYNQVVIDSYSRAYTRQLDLHGNILNLKEYVSAADASITQYLKTGNRARLSDFNNVVKRAWQVTSALAPMMEGDETYYVLRSIENSFETYFAECSAASFLYNSGNYDFYSRMFYAQAINGYLQRYCDELLALVLADSAAASEQLLLRQKEVSLWNRVIALLLFILFGIFLTYITLVVTRPLAHLGEQAAALSRGDFSVRVKVRNPRNSVGALSLAFNSMVESIGRMMETEKAKAEAERSLMEEHLKNSEYRELLREAKFQALQSQTNPHFLFNTLSSISRIVTFGMNKQAVAMIDSLATLLRYSLSDASQPVLLADEIAIVQEYLCIQNVRFGDRVAVDIRVDEELARTLSLPRFTLQPLVENAFVHGLEPLEGPGQLIVQARRRSGYGMIRIYDNGAGFTPERLAQVLDAGDPSASRRIGIGNTRERLRLFSEGRSVFTIASRTGRGTLLTILLPLEGGSGVHAVTS